MFILINGDRSVSFLQRSKEKEPCPLLTWSFSLLRSLHLSASRSLRLNIYPPLIGLFSLVSFILLFFFCFFQFSCPSPTWMPCVAPKVSLPLGVVHHFPYIVSWCVCARGNHYVCVCICAWLTVVISGSCKIELFYLLIHNTYHNNNIMCVVWA